MVAHCLSDLHTPLEGHLLWRFRNSFLTHVKHWLEFQHLRQIFLKQAVWVCGWVCVWGGRGGGWGGGGGGSRDIECPMEAGAGAADWGGESPSNGFQAPAACIKGLPESGIDKPPHDRMPSAQRGSKHAASCCCMVSIQPLSSSLVVTYHFISSGPRSKHLA